VLTPAVVLPVPALVAAPPPGITVESPPAPLVPVGAAPLVPIAGLLPAAPSVPSLLQASEETAIPAGSASNHQPEAKARATETGIPLGFLRLGFLVRIRTQRLRLSGRFSSGA
jgi:hypothetical protein